MVFRIMSEYDSRLYTKINSTKTKKMKLRVIPKTNEIYFN